jgi:hypothetical protein
MGGNKNIDTKRLEVCRVFMDENEEIKGGDIFSRLRDRGHEFITLKGTYMFLAQDMNGLLDTEMDKRVKVYRLSSKGVGFLKRHKE